MSTGWASYVPDYFLHDLEAFAGEHGLGRIERGEAVALFSDVSGFTPMSEALSAVGKRGAEELNSVLNSYFEPMIDLIGSYGGIVTKFAGDAMMVLFPFDPGSQRSTVRRALRCALDMQRAMDRYETIQTSAGDFSLTMKAGLGSGPVFATVVGEPSLRLEHVVAGPAIDTCVAAEGWAKPGDVVASDDLLRPVDSIEARPVGDGFSLVLSIGGKIARMRPRPVAAISSGERELLRRFLHPAIAERVARGHVGFVNEHRKVTVLFVSFPDLEYEDPNAGAGLQRHFAEVARVIDRYEAYLRQIDVGDKGSKYIVVLGAPVTHEDDVDRALHCALELRELADTPIRIGVCTGLAYCGRVGSKSRQEYAVMGDTVNTAARLMGAAEPGQILVAGGTRSEASEPFSYEVLAPVKLKGKAEPLAIVGLLGVGETTGPQLHEPHYGLPMIGRDEALRAAVEAIDVAKGANGLVLSVSGEAGIGKSRLSAEIVRLARLRGFSVFGGACRPYAAASAYQVWRPIWRDLLGLDRGGALDKQIEHLESRLAAVDPELARRLPLLAPLLALPIPDNDLTRSLDAELRAELLRSVLLDSLRSRAEQEPLLLVLEDCHWIDAPSLGLLEMLGHNLASLPVLLVVLYRTPAERSPVTSFAESPHYAEVRLAVLSDDETRAVVAAKLEQLYGQGHEPSKALLDRILEQAAGNPLYVEELLNFLHARSLEPEDVEGARTLELPDSLSSLVLARVDQLPEAEKTTLRVASVLGRLFPARWVSGSYPQAGSDEAVRGHLETLDRLEFTPRYSVEPELQYVFKHAVTHEVAYESLTFAVREELHEAAGAFIERTYHEELTPYLDALALHFGRSRNTDKQREYFRLAGDAARDAYANDAAAEYYRRLVPLLPESERSQILRGLGGIWQLTGRWSEAEVAYREALELAAVNSDEAGRAACEASLGSLFLLTKSYDEALGWLEEAYAALTDLADLDGLTHVLEHLAMTHFERGDYERMRECAGQQLAIASELGDKGAMSAAWVHLGRLHWYLGEYERASRYLQTALELATDAGHRQNLIHAANDLAGIDAERGDYAAALARVQQAAAGAAEIGYRLAVGTTVGNAGELYRRQGESASALACYAYAIKVATEIRALGSTLVTAVGNTAIACADIGLEEDAARFYERSVGLARALNAQTLLSAYLHYWGTLAERQGRYRQAYEMNAEALEIAKAAANREINYLADVLGVRLRVALADLAESEAIEELESMLTRWTSDAEQAGLLYEIWRLDRRRDDSRARAARLYREVLPRTPDAEYRRRYEALTGETVPPPPPLPTLPQIEADPEPDLAALLDQVDELTGSLADRTTR